MPLCAPAALALGAHRLNANLGSMQILILGTLDASEQKSEVWYVKLGNLDMEKKSFEELVSFSNEEVLKKMRAARDKIAKFIWTGAEEG